LTARTVSLVDRGGSSRSLPLPPKSYEHPRFSRDGDKLSFWIQQMRCDIEVYDLARGSTMRLTSDGDNHVPVWSPDGLRVAYTSRKLGGDTLLFWKPVNGNGPEERVSPVSGNLVTPTPLAWLPDASAIIVANGGDLWLFPRSGNPEPRPLIQSKFVESAPALSSDGRWLAYVSDESGQFQVYVQAFPGPGEKHPVSTDGGTEPVWARSGRELFFRSGSEMMVSDIVASSASFKASRPRVLFRAPFAANATYADYDVSPDGQHFVMLNSGEQEGASGQIGVLINWFEELKQRVPMR
jgi:Tol biopolymer transport system component